MKQASEWMSKKYFEDITNRIKSDTLFDDMETANELHEIGITVIERADLTIRSEINARRKSALKDAAIEAFEFAVKRYPTKVQTHLTRSYGVFSYSGIFSNDVDIKRTWKYLAPYIVSHPELQKFSEISRYTH